MTTEYKKARADALQPSPFAGPAEMRAKKMSALALGVDALGARIDALAAPSGSKNRAMSRATLTAKISSGDYIKVGEERGGWQSVWSNGALYEVKILGK